MYAMREGTASASPHWRSPPAAHLLELCNLEPAHHLALLLGQPLLILVPLAVRLASLGLGVALRRRPLALAAAAFAACSKAQQG